LLLGRGCAGSVVSDGASVTVRQSQFADLNIESFKITAPDAGDTDATVEAVINGKKYISFAGIGTKIAAGSSLSLQMSITQLMR